MKTNCAKNCSSEDEGKCQPFPKNGPLKDNLDLSLKCLKEKLKNEKGQLYIYILTTVQKNNNGLIQTGSGPNFQGGCVTLCSCKHPMRAEKEMKQLLTDGKSVWIAGFTDKKSGNWLFYLMRVQKAFASQCELWKDEYVLPKEARQAKNARYSKFGDIYEPMSTCNDPFDFAQYCEPRYDHVHAGSPDFNCFKNKKPLVRPLYEALVQDSIINRNNNQDLLKALSDVLSNPELRLKIINQLQYSSQYVKNYIHKLCTIYERSNKPEDLKKLNRYLLEQRYPKETKNINSNSWHKDIDHPRRPVMLMGAPKLSFIWGECKIMKPNGEMSKHGEICSICKKLSERGYSRIHKVCDIQSFLSCLGETNK